MDIENLFLEVTRMCTLECEHCLRGDRRKEYMSTETINNAFKGVKKVDKLLITGGEPLLAIRQINDVILAIKNNNVKVKEILIISNGTVISERIINVLTELSKLGKLRLPISYDYFHYLELVRLGLLEKRQHNAQVFTQLFASGDYGSFEEPRCLNKLINPIGKTLKLSPERLGEINRLSGINYRIASETELKMLTDNEVEYDAETNSVDGRVSIDVYGNVTAYSLSFDSEDEEIYKYSSNINEIGLYRAILNFIEYYNTKDKEDKKLEKVI